MFILDSEHGCPRCHARMFKSEIVTHDFTTCSLDENGKVKCEYVYMTTESIKECPVCGIRIHVFIPHIKGE